MPWAYLSKEAWDRAPDRECHPRPAEAPWQKSQAGQEVNRENRNQILPMGPRAGLGPDGDGLGHGGFPVG